MGMFLALVGHTAIFDEALQAVGPRLPRRNERAAATTPWPTASLSSTALLEPGKSAAAQRSVADASPTIAPTSPPPIKPRINPRSQEPPQPRGEDSKGEDSELASNVTFLSLQSAAGLRVSLSGVIQGPATVVKNHRGKARADVFYSLAPLSRAHGGFVAVFKRKMRGRQPELFAIELDKAFKVSPANGPPRSLGRGEDPRVFRFLSHIYCLTWLHIPDGNDWDHRLIRISGGKHYLAFPLNHCVHGFRGKNWVPMPFGDVLYVAYRVHPTLKVFRVDVHTGECVASGSGVADYARTIDEITPFRGGSNAVPFGSNGMLTVGHKTVDGDVHIPYLMQVNMDDFSTIVTELQFPAALQGRSKLIMDPTSLWYDADLGQLRMGTVTTAGRWAPLYHRNCSECWFNNSVYDLDLRTSLPHPPLYFTSFQERMALVTLPPSAPAPRLNSRS